MRKVLYPLIVLLAVFFILLWLSLIHIYNGKEILILDGADRYFAAVKAGAFIQKHFLNALDETLTANEEIDTAQYLK